MEYSKTDVLYTLKFFASVVASLVFIISIAFALGAHTKIALLYSSWGAIISTVGALAFLALKAIRQETRPNMKDIWVTLFCASFLGCVTVLFYYGIGIAVYDAYNFATSPYFSKTSSVIVVGLATLVSGVSLFLVRLKFRCLYGISEAFVGVIVASQRFYSDALLPTSHAPTPFIVLAILTAGVYLVVRGADNIHQGLTKEPKDPIAEKILLLLSNFGKTTSMEISITMPTGRVIKYKNFSRTDYFPKKMDEEN